VLGANAAKHRALNDSDGSIRIHWFANDRVRTLDSREMCERKFYPPARKGFGFRLIQQTIVGKLQGTNDTAFNWVGLHAVFTIPLSVDGDLGD
jgi:two-component sensor histidine kinase